MERLQSYLETYPEKGNAFALASRVIEALQSGGHEAHIVGGFARDLLRGEMSKDVDVATSAKPEDIQRIQVDGIAFVPIEAAEALPVVKAVSDGLDVEIATYRKDIYEAGAPASRLPNQMDLGVSLIDDAQRRDLTINALYFDPLSEQMLDPTEQGIADVEKGIIRFVGDPKRRILEDRVRILRAVRFKNSFKYEYDPETRSALQELAGEVENIRGKDRILTELIRMVAKPNRAEAIQDLDELGILEHLLPEFTAGKEMEQSPNHHSEGTVFDHQMLALRNLPAHASVHVVMATLLHDIGKRFTQSIDEEGAIHYFGHEDVSVELARKVLNRLRMKQDDLHAILWLIGNHMKVRQFLDMRRSNQVTMVMPHLRDPKIKRDDLFDDLLVLFETDGTSSLGPDGTPGFDREKIAKTRQRAAELRAESLEKKPMVRDQYGLDGRALIDLLQVEEGQKKYLSSLIAYLNEEYQNNPALSRVELEEKAREWWELRERGNI